jgi:glycosyltransferase involved in cell wall biosynthesis
MNRRLLYVVTPGEYFLSHRAPLALAARASGWDVHVAVPKGDADDHIAAMGFTVHDVPIARAPDGVVREARSLLWLMSLFRRLVPSVVHLVSPKATALGGVAARLSGIPAVLMMGGLGTAFLEGTIRSAVERSLIRAALLVGLGSRARLVIQNESERAKLTLTARMRERTVLIAGSGVDLDSFKVTPEPPGPITVLLPARMLRSKGVEEFVAAARLVRQDDRDVRFWLAGNVDPSNRSSISKDTLEQWHREGVVEWLGYCSNMPQLLERCHIVCLPSYGEGLPRALVEAAAAGKPLVATDVPGCSDVARPGCNALLVSPRDAGALAGALHSLIHDGPLRRRFGVKSREVAHEYRFEQVATRTLALYERLAASAATH